MPDDPNIQSPAEYILERLKEIDSEKAQASSALIDNSHVVRSIYTSAGRLDPLSAGDVDYVNIDDTNWCR